MDTKTLRKSWTFRTLIFVFAFQFFGVFSFGQRAIYEIKYKFFEKGADGIQRLSDQEYTSVIFYYDLNSTNNIMRTRYYDAKDGWVVVEQKINMSLSTANEKNYWTLAGANAKFVTAVSTGSQYNPDNIVLSKNPADTYYSPDYVFDNANNKGSITSFKVLTTADMSTAYLAPYKWSWQNTNTTTTTTKNTVDLKGSTMHLLLVTNSNDETLGEGFEANHQNVKNLFKEVAATCNMNLDVVEVDGGNFGKTNVSNAIDNLSAGTNDVVVFYYSGHGFRFPEQKVDWPQLDLRSGGIGDIRANTLNLGSDVYMSLVKKNARLLMVIGECCNVPFGAGTPFIKNPAALPLGSNVFNSNAVKTLFSRSGKILVATSKPSESSWYYSDTGGIFFSSFSTSFFSKVGFTSTSSNAKWEDIFDNAITYTTERSLKDKERGIKTLQHPIHYYDIK